MQHCWFDSGQQGRRKLAPVAGTSFQTNYRNIHDLVPYLRDGNQHDFGHTVYDLSFTGDDEYDFNKAQKSQQMKRKLGIASNPLDQTTMKVRIANFLLSYTFSDCLFRRAPRNTCSSTSSRSYQQDLSSSTVKR